MPSYTDRGVALPSRRARASQCYRENGGLELAVDELPAVRGWFEVSSATRPQGPRKRVLGDRKSSTVISALGGIVPHTVRCETM